jgi:mannitol-1-/sugar-/sorbitol-6-phosphatase
MVRILCRGVLFDLDGVLVDSTPAVARVWSAWARERGMDPADTVRRAHGRPSIETIRELLPHADAEKENALVERRELDDMRGMVTLPGALELLRTLPEASWTVVTSCTRALAIRRLEAAGLPVPRQLVTASDIRRGKPDPEPYLKGAERLGLAARDCIAFEDAPAGIRSARAAGARVIGVRTTAREPELRAAGASFVVDDLSSLSGAPSRDGLRLELQGESAA